MCLFSLVGVWFRGWRVLSGVAPCPVHSPRLIVRCSCPRVRQYLVRLARLSELARVAVMLWTLLVWMVELGEVAEGEFDLVLGGVRAETEVGVVITGEGVFWHI